MTKYFWLTKYFDVAKICQINSQITEKIEYLIKIKKLLKI